MIQNEHIPEWVERELLRPHPENPRQGNVEAIRASIRSHGFFSALVVEKLTGYILVGSHRFEAGVLEGLERFPVFWFTGSTAEGRALMLADNRTSDIAAYQEEKLRELLKTVERDGLIEASGYEREDVAAILAAAGPEESVEELTEPTGPMESALRGKLKTITLTFEDAEDYETIVAALRQIRDISAAETNADAVVWLVGRYADDLGG